MPLRMTGAYLEIDRPRQLRQTIGMPDFSPGFDVVTFDIADDGDGGCVVTFEQTGSEIAAELEALAPGNVSERDPKSTRLNSSHVAISYAVCCLNNKQQRGTRFAIVEEEQRVVAADEA